MFEKGSAEWNMMGDFYRLCRDYWKANETDQYWDALLDATEALNQKYHNPTLLALIVGFVGAKEDEYCRLQGRKCRPDTEKWKKVEI